MDAITIYMLPKKKISQTAYIINLFTLFYDFTQDVESLGFKII